MSGNHLAVSAVVIATTTVVAAPAQSATVMLQPFNTTNQGGLFETAGTSNPMGTIDDTANGGGIWKSTQADAQTTDLAGWGNLGGGLRIRDRASTPGGVVSGDLGTTLSSGVVSLTLDLNRATRGGIIGGRATERLTNLGGSASEMLFGVIWEHNFVYPINPVPGGYYGDLFIASPNSNATWQTLTFTLDFNDHTYDVFFSEFNTTWSNLPMNMTAGFDVFKYVYLESIDGFGASVFYDNIHVQTVPEPAAMGLVGLVGVGLLRRRSMVSR